MSARLAGGVGGSGDDAIRGTNDDALASKLSAIAAGYIQDEYAKALGKRGPPVKRPPIINRGTYARYQALTAFVAHFLESRPEEGPKQIVSLGSGSDTRYFAFKSSGRQPQKWFEMDFPEVTTRKAMALKKNKALSALVGDSTLGLGGSELYGSDYCLLSGDLRQWQSVLVPKLLAQGFDTKLPTLFISECVLIYLPPEVSTAILGWIAMTVPKSMFICYEQILPDDAFGRTMIDNLRSRNIDLLGIHAHPTLESQTTRYLGNGWAQAFASDMNSVWAKCISSEEKARIAKLEIFDEVEEWILLSRHYCIAWACTAQALSSDQEWQEYIDAAYKK